MPGIFQTLITDALVSPTTTTKQIRLYFFNRNLNARLKAK
nr:MAG TPA: hypothetical protein [Caudoviricetes sp.]